MTYTLKISTEIHSDDYDDRIEASYPCRYSCEDGVHRLKYTDDEVGFTVFKVMPDGEIQIRRQHSFTIIMRKKYSHSVDCETPYGTIPMEFTLRDFFSAFGEEGGRIQYTAQVVIGGKPQTNSVTMELIPTERIDCNQ